MVAVLELTGERGVGKTTLSRILADELSPAATLLIDASVDQQLTATLVPTPPAYTLGQLFAQKREAVATREAVDWAVHDLTVQVGEESELMTVGGLVVPDEPELREKLRYGFSRLLAGYAYVVVDGFHPVIHNLLPDELRRTLIVLTPEHFENWSLPEALSPLRTPVLILNRYQNEPLPPSLEAAMMRDDIKLIGKLSQYPTAEDCIRQLPGDFRNALFRLNIPLNRAKAE